MNSTIVEGSGRAVARVSLVLWLRIGLLAGMLATLGLDLVGIGAILAGVPAPYHLPYVGRWFLYVLRGNFVVPDIAQLPALPGELVAHVIGHYLIGVTLGISYIFLIHRRVKRSPWVTAPLYGLVLSFLPWLVMYPALGYGFFGLHMPNAGIKIFAWPVFSHFVYGLWLGLWTILLQKWIPRAAGMKLETSLAPN